MEEARYLEVANVNRRPTREGSEQHHMLRPHDRHEAQRYRFVMHRYDTRPRQHARPHAT